MKLKKILARLNELEKRYWNIEVITAADDEWNSYSPVVYLPNIMYINGLIDHRMEDVRSADELEWGEEDYTKVICLN